MCTDVLVMHVRLVPGFICSKLTARRYPECGTSLRSREVYQAAVNALALQVLLIGLFFVRVAC